MISVSPELINNLSSAVADIQTQLQQLQDKQVYNKRVVADITNGAAEALKGATGTIDGLTTVKATLDQALIPGGWTISFWYCTTKYSVNNRYSTVICWCSETKRLNCPA